MKIETKFNIGDWVWYMRSKSLANTKVNEIKIMVDRDGKIEIEYAVVLRYEDSNMTEWNYENEEDVFATKQELIDSL